MTVVEFYDRDSAENIAGALVCEPDRIVFVGCSEKQMQKSAAIYRSITWDRDLDIEFVIKKTVKNNLTKICDTLIEIVEEYEDCIFDLGGGEDLFLVAAGIVQNMYPDRVKFQSFNISSSTVTDCFSGDSYDVSHMVKLGVEENVCLYGGKILYESDNSEGSFNWEIDDKFGDDIFVMWSICKEDPHQWNKHTHALGIIDSLFRAEGTLDITIYPEKAKQLLAEHGESYVSVRDIMSELSKFGLIKHLCYEKNSYSFTYKNEQVRKCLTKAGQILELYVTMKALDLCDSDAEPFFNDVMTGVCLDWDGRDSEADEVNIKNEIDVVLMKDMIPIFISCKNGTFNIDELYKLSSVANKFGGRHAKKVLVATDLERMGEQAKYIRARARDMKIRIIENTHKLSSSEFDRALKSLYAGL